MDPEADAYASCPRYDEADTAACRCPCPGCVHHCAAHQEAPGYDETAREAYAEQGEAEGNGCGICTQFTPCPNPGIGCYVNPPAALEGDFERIDNPTRVTPACTLCDDSDEAFCAFHDTAERRVHTTVADGVTYTAASGAEYLIPRPDFTHGGTYPCPGPAQCADFDCPCG